MIRFLIFRPISVFMAFAAFFILGVITYLNIPVSLLPDIAIPEITVQVTGNNMSARELENSVVEPVRRQLLQIGKLRDIRSETRDGNAIIRLNFEYGANTDLAFIEVNEKIDAAMNHIPRDVPRPRVIKASATDIPVLSLNLSLKDDDASFLDLSEFAETVIKRRIEQLPEIALVDITGLVNKEVLIQPDNNMLSISGITLSDIETALQNNNIEPGSMIVRDGHYEYNIKFSAALRTVDDIRNIYIRKNDKIFQLKNIAHVDIVSEKERGIALYNGKRAVVLNIIKQSDENMSNMKKSLSGTLNHLENRYPEIEFNISQSQTELLDFTISNLQRNLILAFIFVCLISVFFMRNIRSPLIIGLGMFVSLVVSLMFFYLFNISLNMISLTGLIIALGMMIDNSIIVTDNIEQYQQRGHSLDEACIKGTNEVITPMLSSIFTTIVVFIPLVFISGIAGAVFFDQAFSVTVGLLISYITGIILLPVLYKIVYSTKKASTISLKSSNLLANVVLMKFYDKGINWVFSHKIISTLIIFSFLPLCYIFFHNIRKDMMPEISQNELLLFIEWNENIHVEQNNERTIKFLSAMENHTVEHSAMIAQQQFMLNREREQTSSETHIYLKTPSNKDIEKLKYAVATYFSEHHPEAIISFSPVATIFERIFNTAAPDLVVEFYARNRSQAPDAHTIRNLENELTLIAGEKPVGLSFQKQLNLHIDREKLLLYRVPYDEVYRALRAGFRANEFAVLRSYQQYLPIVIADAQTEQTIREIIDNILINTYPDENAQINRLPLSAFVTTTPSEDLKTIIAGRNGEYIQMNFHDAQHVENIIGAAKQMTNNNNNWEVVFSGAYFFNKRMINELIIVLLISVLLMYFILAAQFESFVQPLIILIEIPIDTAAVLAALYFLGHSLNLMSAIGIVVTCAIVINDSILKVAMINQLRRDGYPLMEAIHEAGRRRLKAIVMTSLTTIVCMAPLLFSSDMGSELGKPLAIATISGMITGTFISLFFVPLTYYRVKSLEFRV